jgi:recombination protein RecA
MGVQARLMSQALRKLTSAISKSKTTVMFTNQLRQKIGVMFGNPETTTGGNALKFYASVRLDVRRIEALKDGQSIIGNRTRVKVVKNKVAPPFKEALFDILYNEGISKLGDLIDTAVEQNIIAKSGSWFSYKDERIGQGRDSVKTYLQANAALAKEIDTAVRRKLGLLPAEPAPPAAPIKAEPAAASKKTAKS